MLLNLKKKLELNFGQKHDPEFDSIGKVLGFLIMNSVAPADLKSDFIKLYNIGKSLIEKECVEIDHSDFKKLNSFIDEINIRISDKAQIALCLSECWNENRNSSRNTKEENVKKKK